MSATPLRPMQSDEGAMRRSGGGWSLTGKRAVVTGGSLGAGAAVVRRLKQDGATVTAVARTTPADTVADVFVAADITKADGLQSITAEMARQGGVDIVVHVAGFIQTTAADHLVDRIASSDGTDRAAASVVGVDMVVDGGTVPTV